MADEPENLILKLPREIRACQIEMRETQVEQGRRLNRIEQRIDEVHETMYQVAGFAMHANVRHDTVTALLKVLEERIGRLEEKA